MIQFLLSALLFAPPLTAKPGEIQCKQDQWHLSRGVTLPDITRMLDKLPRKRVIQMAWGEMLAKNSKDSMALPLLQYLAGTESDSVLRGYFKTLLHSVIQPLDTKEALAIWPMRPKTQQPTNMKLSELCLLYNKSLKDKHN